MARPLPILPTQKLYNFLPAPVNFLIILMAVFSVFSAVTFLCGSSDREEKKKKSVRLGGKKEPMIKKLHSGLSSKALLMAQMISWRKVQDEGEEEFGYDEHEDMEDEDGVVWKKTIIKGEKCRPLDFSGKILYDSNGNLLPD